ncbi:unnamed protein product [Vitrella brassicaformis CCMP3155]|uniref:PLD phosphodiesterase domain-containing protein n=1 Tax=Vitrella brassicaformis (strain CCMP3155) TaxID=1169540 RepID=A0A0G4ETF8_VITBC|nr:unnamed protein product [Vitrella brassicaformis CCMP3155]|eukprot:CEM01729.1 unnamed protein product [Vitrella brassicaformis CCMP3155]
MGRGHTRWSTARTNTNSLKRGVIDLTQDDAHDGTAENPQDLTQDADEALAKRAEPARKKGRVSETAWLWRCQPFYLNAIVDYGRDGEGSEGCLSIRDVIDGPVQEMLLASMRFDLPWLVDECPVMKTMRRITILTGDPRHQPQRKVDRVEELRQDATNLQSHGPKVPVEVCPLRDAYASFHPKLIILTYADHIRVCIASANFTYSNWWRRNQAIYVQDFPRKKQQQQQQQQGSQPSTDDMENHLADFLHATTKAGDWCNKVREFDYSTAIGKIVASVPGSHQAPDVNRWGHMRMRELLKNQPDPQDWTRSHLVCQVPSVGSLDEDFIEDLIGGLCVSPSHPEIAEGTHLTWQLILPTVDEVRNSLEGWVAGEAIHVTKDRLLVADKREPGKREDLPPDVFHRWGYHKPNGEPACRGAALPHPPNRTSACPHLKTFLKYGHRAGDSSKRPELAWVYVGSHNLSKAAWGELQDNDNKLSIRSYELGILISPHTLRGRTPPPPHTTPHTQLAGSSSSSSSSSGAATQMRSFMWRKSNHTGQFLAG